VNFRIPDFALGASLMVALYGVGLLFVFPDVPSGWFWQIVVSLTAVLWIVGAIFFHNDHNLEKLEKQNPRTDKDEQPDKEQNEYLQVGASDFAALIETIKAEGKASRAEKSKECGTAQFPEYVSIGIIAVTMLAIVMQVREMVKVYDPIRDQAETAKNGLRSVQRAFITVPKLNSYPRTYNGKIISWIVDPVVVNSGTTPTVNMHYTIGFGGPDMHKWPTDKQNPVDPIVFPTLDDLMSLKGMARTIIGPQSTIDNLTSLNGFTADILTGHDLQAETGEFVYGAFIYGDVFEHKPTHITEFCFAVIRTTLTNDNMLHFSRCRHHNCADEECYAESAKN
jgi:hypothetical protein